MEKWEYISFKIETKGFMGGVLATDDLNHQLNKLGEEGWELVSCFTTNQGQGSSREVIAVLKRRKQ